MKDAARIYGIMERKGAEALLAGISGEPGFNLKIEAKGTVAAVLGSPTRRRLPQRKKRLKQAQQTQYVQILERMMEEGAVLPAPLCQPALSKRAVHFFLGRHADELCDMLATLGGKIEIGVTVKWDIGQFVLGALARRTPEEPLAEAGFQPRKVCGIQSEILLEQLKLKQTLLDQLTPHIVDRLVEKTSSLDGVLRARFLVEPSQEHAIYRILTGPEMAANGLRAHFHGPLPPHSFVDLKPLLAEHPTGGALWTLAPAADRDRAAPVTRPALAA